MTMEIGFKDFARRVERVCDFFLAKVSEEGGRNGSQDVKVLEDLKEEAANIQFNRIKVISGELEGLYDYMNGVHVASEEKVGKE